jgi:probable RcsB/C two-component-system connector
MRQDGLPPVKDAGLSGYFSQVTHPCQIALLGRITVEILRQERRLTRTAVCLKMIARLDATSDETEAAHLMVLLRMLFNR